MKIDTIQKIRLLSWGTVFVAFLLWVAVFWTLWRLLDIESAWVVRAADVEQVAAREVALSRLRSLARDTKEERGALKERVSVDVIRAVDVIEDAGEASGVELKIGGAVAENVPGARASSPTRSLALVISAQGTFSRLVHVLALLETLPIPSELLKVELRKVSGSKSDWTLSTRVLVITTNINSL